MSFTIQAQDTRSKARAGSFETAHGRLETPVFMPVGTQGTVKALHWQELKDPVGAQIVLGNTYHLYLRPGLDTLQKAGGLHGFTGWDRPILTDSGGYQVYSLGDRRKLSENGAVFASHIDGSKHLFTPENVMDTQRIIGADIIMAFDECTPYPCEYGYAQKSMERTHRWLARCWKQFHETTCPYGYEQQLFPIVQGSVYPDLRKASAEFVASFDAPGNAIGGLSVGEPHEDMYAMTDQVTDILPRDKPRYLMGVGTPLNILQGIALGIDMFDCVLPTRNARHGVLYTSEGIIQIKNQCWKEDFSPIDPLSPAPTSRLHSKAYLRHLFVCQEFLALQIASIHNLSFFLWLTREARAHLLAGDFSDWKAEMDRKLGRRLGTQSSNA
jgi:queuine tRNA-ribosyltransferase